MNNIFRKKHLYHEGFALMSRRSSRSSDSWSKEDSVPQYLVLPHSCIPLLFIRAQRATTAGLKQRKVTRKEALDGRMSHLSNRIGAEVRRLLCLRWQKNTKINVDILLLCLRFSLQDSLGPVRLHKQGPRSFPEASSHSSSSIIGIPTAARAPCCGRVHRDNKTA